MQAKWHQTKESLQIEEMFEELQEKFDEEKILFLTFDFTNHASKHQARLLADALGIRRIISYYKEPGQILLIDPRSKKLVKQLTADMSFQQMSQLIELKK